MFVLYTRPGKHRLATSHWENTDEVVIRVHVCVGDMNAEQGGKLAAELPG